MSRSTTIKRRLCQLIRHLAALLAAYVVFCSVGGILIVGLGVPALTAGVDCLDSALGGDLSPETVARSQLFTFLGGIPLVALGVITAYIVAKKVYIFIEKVPLPATDSKKRKSEIGSA